MILDRHANMKYKFENGHFWSDGYYVSTVGLKEATIKKYIQDQEKYDIMQDKSSVKEYEFTFWGGATISYLTCLKRAITYNISALMIPVNIAELIDGIVLLKSRINTHEVTMNMYILILHFLI